MVSGWMAWSRRTSRRVFESQSPGMSKSGPTINPILATTIFTPHARNVFDGLNALFALSCTQHEHAISHSPSHFHPAQITLPQPPNQALNGTISGISLWHRDLRTSWARTVCYPQPTRYGRIVPGLASAYSSSAHQRTSGSRRQSTWRSLVGWRRSARCDLHR